MKTEETVPLRETRMVPCNIRMVPETLVRRLRVRLLVKDITLAEWFVAAAGWWLDEDEKRDRKLAQKVSRQ